MVATREDTMQDTRIRAATMQAMMTVTTEDGALRDKTPPAVPEQCQPLA